MLVLIKPPTNLRAGGDLRTIYQRIGTSSRETSPTSRRDTGLDLCIAVGGHLSGRTNQI